MRRRIRLRSQILILLVIYCIGLAMGAYVLFYIPIYSHRAGLEDEGQKIISCLVSGQTAEEIKYTNMYAFFCTPDGTMHFMDSYSTPPDLDYQQIIRQPLSAVLSGKTYYDHFSADIPSSGHGLQIFILSGQPVVQNGSVTGAVFILKDVVDLAKNILSFFSVVSFIFCLTLVFLCLTDRNNRRVEQTRQNYIDNITHDLKSPISSIKALVMALSDHNMSQEKQSEYYGLILQEANNQEQMIRNILELSKIQGRNMDFGKRRFRAEDLFAPIIGKYRNLCDDTGVLLHVSPSITQLPDIYTNQACLERIINILFDNAIKFVGADGEIWLEGRPCRGHVTICVRDNGVGISKEDQAKIFGRFYMGGGNHNPNGNGLGLAIAKELTAALDEKIWVESEPGRGASFFFTISCRPR